MEGCTKLAMVIYDDFEDPTLSSIHQRKSPFYKEDAYQDNRKSYSQDDDELKEIQMLRD